MNYQKVYSNLIERARTQNRVRSSEVYYESHHIVPKCMGGSNKKENLVLLTAREHFICHWLLTLIYPEHRSLIFGFWAMCHMDRGGRAYKVSSRTYDWLCIEASKEKSRIQSARVNPILKCSYCEKEVTGNLGMSAHKKSCSLNPNRLLVRGKRPKYRESECPHCGKVGCTNNMKRWHFDNCKLKKLQSPT